jgi:hypothetical protein
MFVRERGRGGVDGAFLPDIDVFSVQVMTLMISFKPQTSNLKPQTSNLKPQTSNLKPQTSNLKPQTCRLTEKSLL